MIGQPLGQVIEQLGGQTSEKVKCYEACRSFDGGRYDIGQRLWTTSHAGSVSHANHTTWGYPCTNT